MTPRRNRLSASVTLVLLSLASLAFAQVPGAPDSKPVPAAAPETPVMPAPDAKDAAKAAPAASDVSKDAAGAPAKTTSAGETADAVVPSGPLGPLAWLNGCWMGTVNKREFREYWHPLRGGMMVGVGHNALPDKTISYEHLRLESKPDGVFYVAIPSGQKEVPFKLTGTRREGPDELFLFSNAANPFPTTILYRRATGGWLYVEVAGKVNAKDHKVIYPFRRVSCESGEFIRK